MKQDQRSKTARVAALMLMAKERGRPVTRQAARNAVQIRINDVWYYDPISRAMYESHS